VLYQIISSPIGNAVADVKPLILFLENTGKKVDVFTTHPKKYKNLMRLIYWNGDDVNKKLLIAARNFTIAKCEKESNVLKIELIFQDNTERKKKSGYLDIPPSGVDTLPSF